MGVVEADWPFLGVCFLGRGEAFLVPIPTVGRENHNKHEHRGLAVFVLDPLKKKKTTATKGERGRLVSA